MKIVTPTVLLCACAGLVALVTGCAAPRPRPSLATPVTTEPTAASCDAAVEAARAAAAELPEDDLSRRFAASLLNQARTEAGNGEFDDCLEYAARASVEVREHRHRLLPGETLDVPAAPR